jgi:peptidoglycan hydrolase-like protein with peptidoglycan-binding domain
MSYDRWLRRKKAPEESVRTFQRRLRERGWKTPADGKFTKQVEAVVSAFQREKRLKIHGRVDEPTWSAIWEAPVT